MIKGFVIGVALAFCVVVGGAYAFIAMGMLPVGADNAPGTIERTLSHKAVNAYVERHAERAANPVQITSAALSEGAREYEEHCALCHGGAHQRISSLRYKFSPPVPQIINRVPHDEEYRLFWVTKHGTRMTGMPAWDGILTDEQMWKIIAFVKRSNQLPPEVQQAWVGQPQR